jgi:hypothetical protein
MKVKQYKAVVEPYRLEGGLNALTWSIPFLAIKVTELLEMMLKRVSNTARVPGQQLSKTEVEFDILL